jgi:hypothetical protein
MSNFLELQNEVKRRSIRDQGGAQFDDAIKNAINSSLFRTAREALWRVLRRDKTFETELGMTTALNGTSVTNGSKTFTVSSETLITTNSIENGRMFACSGSNLTYRITAISESGGDTTITSDIAFDGTTSASASLTILPREEYNLPIQASHRLFMWHNALGFTYQMKYITDQEFRSLGVDDTTEDTPTHYRMWGEDMALEQPGSASVLTVSSSSSSDTSIDITIFGTVSGYPDFETITTNASNGTTTVSGSKAFSEIERVVKQASSAGRITVTSNSGIVTVAVLPVGNTISGIMYRKVQLWPLPTKVFPIHAMFYKEPFKLVNNSDVHDMGDQFDEAIILLAVAKLKYQNNQKEGDRFLTLWTDEVKSLKRTNVDKLDHLKRLKRPNQDSRSSALLHPSLSFRQLGGAFGPRGY